MKQWMFKMLIGLTAFGWAVTNAVAQEVYFFSEATDATFYDQGIVAVNSLGESTFEHTHPPGAPQYNDKIPASEFAYQGSTSLVFDYFSAENGNWRVTVYRNNWTPASIIGYDSLIFYIYSEDEIPSDALPLIGLRAVNQAGTSDINTRLYPLSEYNNAVPAQVWTRIHFPLDALFTDSENNNMDFSQAKGVIFSQSEFNGTSRLFLLDELVAINYLQEIPPVEDLAAQGYDSHAELSWIPPLDDLTYKIMASFDGGENFILRGETSDSIYFDFVSEQERNSEVIYRVISTFQDDESEPAEATVQIRDYTDEELVDMIQRYTFRYFWEGAHQPSGMILERSNGNGRVVASGATGMGLMALIVGHEREYEPRDSIQNRILSILNFLEESDRFHGAFPHWYNGDTGETIPFSTDDDGGDLVETSFVAQALIALKHYFTGEDEKSVQIREQADRLWREIEWTWYTNNQNVLFWHWSPNVGFQKGMRIQGWNEALITYVMAASSPTYPISEEVYTQGWARNGAIVRPRVFYEQNISLAPDWGGPLFWTHYTHLGIDPHGLEDQYADYWQEHVNTSQIHQLYAIDNPKEFENYSDMNWGLTASDDPFGYTAHAPWLNDNGTISPTAALSSIVYTPEASIMALKYFYRNRGEDLLGIYGIYDAFNDELNWVSNSYIGIDQGPIVVMMENYRTGLIWDLVMQDADVQNGLTRLGFEFRDPTGAAIVDWAGELQVYPNPASGMVRVNWNGFKGSNKKLRIYDSTGNLQQVIQPGSDSFILDVSHFNAGIYFLKVQDEMQSYTQKLIILNY